MIETTCVCGAVLKAGLKKLNQPDTCAACGRAVRYVSAEQLQEGSEGGDFDARLTIVRGPEDIGRELFLGGCYDIEIGKLPQRHIELPGKMVSRMHARLQRIDFGPSRWKIIDQGSTNGLFVNARKVKEQELQHGDVVRIGEYELQYASAVPVEVVARVKDAAKPAHMLSRHGPPSAAVPAHGGPPCPSCGCALAPGAKICIDCGIDVQTGRPIITSKGFDEDELHTNAENVIRVISWPVPFGFYPVASEAFGTKKPMATWLIAGITVVVSLLFLASGCGSDFGDLPAGSGLMLWPANQPPLPEAPPAAESPQWMSPDGEFTWRELEEMVRWELQFMLPRMDFEWYQLLTHALLHADLFHLAGNMLFLLVFGTRVNAVIGNAATAVLYPILAVAAAGAHLWLETDDGLVIPMLGASGAVMGMAGLYLILFPIHRVFMAIWLRWFWVLLGSCILIPLLLRFGLHVSWRVFAVRGFWVVLFYIAFDVLYTTLGLDTGVAHWAHIGGFTAGAGLALVLLISRQINARGADLLSVVLGKHAWALVGRPSDRKQETVPPAINITRYPTG